MLNLYKLEIFAQVVQEGSFSAAANRLLMTQPGVSQHVQDLERALGVMLFNRTSRGVTLTDAGKTLYDYAQRIGDLVAEAEAAVTDVSHLDEGRVDVGATPGVGVYVLAEFVQSFRQRYPNLTVHTLTDTTPRIIDALLARQLELGLIEGELSGEQHAELGVLELEPVRHCVIVGPRHPYWTRASVTLGDLTDQTLVVRQRGSRTRIWLEQTLAAHQITPIIGAEFDNVESIKRAVMAGTGLAVLPDYSVRDDATLGRLRTLRLEEEPLERTLKLIWDQRRHFAPVALFFLRHLVPRFPALAGLPALALAK